jgi:hypothetical protein
MDNIGNETINKEFKVFNFYNAGLELSNEDGVSLIENKKWIFKTFLMDNKSLNHEKIMFDQFMDHKKDFYIHLLKYF